jgi:hypothetical protein
MFGASSLSAIACLLLYWISITLRRFCLTSAFSFSEAVCFLSRESHTEMRNRSSLMSYLSRWSTSCAWFSAKWVMPVALEREIVLGALRPRHPMMTSVS